MQREKTGFLKTSKPRAQVTAVPRIARLNKNIPCVTGFAHECFQEWELWLNEWVAFVRQRGDNEIAP